MDGEAQFHRETHRAQHPDGVFPIALLRIADEPQDAGLMIVHAADVIDHGKIADVVIEGIDREIPPEGILLDRAVDVITQNPAILQNALIMRLLALQRPESGHFDDFLTEMHMRQTETTPDQTAIAKHPPNLLGMGIGHHIEVLGLAAQQQIADTAADQVGFEPGLLQSIQNFQRVFADQRARKGMLRAGVDSGQSAAFLFRRRLWGRFGRGADQILDEV